MILADLVRALLVLVLGVAAPILLDISPVAALVLTALAAQLSPPSTRRYRQLALPRRGTLFAADVLVTEGEESDHVYVIQCGRIRVTQGDRVLRMEGAGEYVGETGLTCDVPRTAGVTALAPTPGVDPGQGGPPACGTRAPRAGLTRPSRS